MPVKQPKRLLILNILDILQRYTNEDHRLSQKEIADILKKEYDMTADRKAIRRNLLNLMDCGYSIEYSVSTRMMPDPATGKLEENEVWSDFYLERTFTDGELRLLIDSLLFSEYIPYKQGRELAEKLAGLSNVYFKSRSLHPARMPGEKADNKQLFLNIELLEEAISRRRKISCHYLEYGTDKELHCKTRPDGSRREYVISPYQMAAREGKYYLICNYDKYDDISNYRIDRMADIRILEEPVKPFEKLEWAHNRSLDLSAYMRKHPYMYASREAQVTFRVCRGLISDVVDLFGGNVRFFDEDESGVTVSTVTNEMAVEQFARIYCSDVEILAPQSVRERVKDSLKKAVACYEREG